MRWLLNRLDYLLTRIARLTWVFYYGLAAPDDTLLLVPGENTSSFYMLQISLFVCVPISGNVSLHLSLSYVAAPQNVKTPPTATT